MTPLATAALLSAACGRAAAWPGAGRAATDGSAAPAVVHWNAPASLTADSGGTAAAFAVAPDGQWAGRVTAAWVAAPARGTAGRLVVRPDLAAPATVTLRDPDGGLTVYGETPPKLASGPDGTLYAAYLVTRAVAGHKWPVNALRLAASPDGGRTWGPPRTVQSDAANGGSTDDHALTVAPDGALVLTWLAMTGDGPRAASHTYVSRSADRSATWSAPAVVDPGPSCPCCRTAIAAGPDGAVYAAWRKIYPAPPSGDPGAPHEVRDIAVARSTDGGRTWGAPVRVHADQWRVSYCPDAGPSVRVGADGTVHVAWWTGKEGAAGVQYTRSRDGGRTWGAPVALGVGARSRAAHVQLAVGGRGDSATVVAAWEDGTRAAPPLVARVSRDGGRTFGSAEVLSDPGAQVGYPVVALTGDTVRVAWQQRTPEAAARDSAARATASGGAHRHGAPAAAEYIQPVGAWQVVVRTGVLARAPMRTAALGIAWPGRTP